MSVPRSYHRGHVFDRMTSAGCCYLIEDRSRRLVKIGWSGNPTKRAKQIAAVSDNPTKLIATLPGGKFREAALHGRFRRQRVRGEWFAPSREMYAAFGVTDYHPFKEA